MVLRWWLPALWLLWTRRASSLKMQQRSDDDELDEEALAELDALDSSYGLEDYGELFDEGYEDDAYYGGLAELLGEGFDDAMLEALLSGDGALADLLESLGIDVEVDDGDYGGVRLVDESEEGDGEL